MNSEAIRRGWESTVDSIRPVRHSTGLQWQLNKIKCDELLECERNEKCTVLRVVANAQERTLVAKMRFCSILS